MFAAILLAVAFVTTITVDLGPGAPRPGREGRRQLSASATSRSAGCPSACSPAHFVVENLRIGGLEKADRPFLRREDDRSRRCRSRALAASRGADRLGRDDRLADGGRDVAERAAQLPEVHARRHAAAGPKRFVTTVRSVLAQRGAVHLRGPRRAVDAPSRAISKSRSQPRADGYGGTARFTDGTVAIQQYLPMQTDMRGGSRIDGAARAVQPAASCSPTARAPTSPARSTCRTGPSRRGT